MARALESAALGAHTTREDAAASAPPLEPFSGDTRVFISPGFQFRVVDALLTPLLTAVRSTPVVSFIILVLMWASSDRLSFVISFLMVLPIIYTNVLEGIRHRDRSLLEVARVFAVPLLRRLPAVDMPAVLPFFVAGCKVGVGLAWKSGIAAEVIGLPRGSIGEQLYQAKLFLSTADLFAWTVVIVAVSFGFERLVLATLSRVQVRVARGRTT